MTSRIRAHAFAAMAMLVGCLWLPLTALAQISSVPLRIGFFNTENLFDCQHDSLTDDFEFLPDGRRRWTPARYYTKLRHVAEVIASMGSDDVPALVGLCEVENDSCLTDLTRHSPFRTAAYSYVMSHGDDPRGIDVALLYSPAFFHLLHAAEHAVPVHTIRSDAYARPMLHVSGVLLTGDTLDVLVCHWPSRLHGTHASEPLRSMAASVVQAVCDSLLAVRTKALVLVMGDFNEPPTGPSVARLEDGAHLINLARTAQPMYSPKRRSDCNGTYRYKGRWEHLDQMLVSPAFAAYLPASGNSSPPALTIYNATFLLEREPIYGGLRPYRTYIGQRYHSGYSNHLPVFADFLLPLD